MTVARLLLFSCTASLFLAALLPAAYSDMKTRTIPNFSSLFLFVAGFLHLFADGFSVQRFLSALLGAAIGGIPLLIMALCRNSVGGGDVKLAASAGFVLGWLWSYLALMTALFAFVLYGCIIQSKKNENKAPCLPFAPFYAAAACGVFILSSLLYFSSVHIAIF